MQDMKSGNSLFDWFNQRLHLTEKAEPVIAELWRQADALTGEFLEGVSANERAAVVHVLERIKQNLMSCTAERSEPADEKVA